MSKIYLYEDENNIAYRLRELRLDHGLSQKELADKINVTHSQISRIESGETKNPNVNIIVSVAKLFHVSTDYLLGLTKITVPKSYDISELGLSEEAVKRLLLEKIDVDVLNRLLEHEQFPRLCVMIRNYFDDTIAEGVMARNRVIDLAIDPLTELMNADPSKRKEIIKDKQFLNSKKLGANEADVEKIKNILMGILRDIKSGMQKKELTTAVATAEAAKAIREALPDKAASDITSEDMTNAVTAYVSQATNLDAQGLEIAQKLIKHIFDSSESKK